ncbi:MAG: (2Fe-2S) ferredoxin domain-containing protein [Chloroflexota bacterium]|nr:(2Fe-2S) ferredoxin domain-containing protein [Rhodospirillaceae bacterium]MDE2960395.1 (2Fe-2S) ferredoxin domain-containing protein [Chloroflexota bacterium]
MSASDPQRSARPEVNVVVCTDEYGCGRWYHRGRNAEDILGDFRAAVTHSGDDRVQVTTAGCILGCTYGPRFDVVRRWSGEKALYGSIKGEATVTRRGRVPFAAIPDDLVQALTDHLPETAAPIAGLSGSNPPVNVDLLRRILSDCSQGISDTTVGLAEAVIMVHNAVATISIPATLDNLQFVDGSGRASPTGDIALLATDGDGQAALQLSRIRQVEFMHRQLRNGMPSYAIWLRDDDLATVYRIYLRRSENPADNPRRHRLFMDLIERYGEKVTL